MQKNTDKEKKEKKEKALPPHWTPGPTGPTPGPAHLSRSPPSLFPRPGSEQGRSPPHHLAGDGEDKDASAPRLLGPLSHSPPLTSRPLRLSLPPQIRAALSFPTPDAVAAVLRRSHGHRAHLAAPRCLQGPPSPAASSGAARWGQEPLQRAHRARLQLRSPATPFFPGADLLLLSLPPASVCRAVSFSPSSPVLSLSRAP